MGITVKHGIRKTNSVVKKKKLHKVLRKVTSVKCDANNKSGTEAESYNTSGRSMSLLSENYTYIDSKALKAKTIIKNDDNFQASASEKVNTCNIKANIIPVATHLQSKSISPLSPYESSRSEVDNQDQVSIKQKKNKGKNLKKSVKNKNRGVQKRMQKNVKLGVHTNFANGVAEKVVSSTLKSDELVKDPKSSNQNKNQKRNPKEVKITKKNEILSGGQVSGSQASSGEKQRRGKITKKRMFESDSKLPHMKGEQILSEGSYSSMDCNTLSLETSVVSLEEENDSLDSQEENEDSLDSREENEDSLDSREENEDSLDSREENEDSLEDENKNSWKKTRVVNGMAGTSFETISPICIEMHGEKDVPPNLFYNSEVNYHTQAGKRVVGEKEYSLWKLKNINEEIEGEVHLATEISNKRNSPRNKEVFPEQFIRLLKNKFLLVLYPGQSVLVSGVLKLKVLVGAIEVLGYRMTSSYDTETIYSPFQSRMLRINAIQLKSQGRKYYEYLKTKIWEQFHGVLDINMNVLHSLPADSNFILFDQEEDSILPLFINKFFPNYFEDILKPSSAKRCLTSGFKASFLNDRKQKGIQAFSAYKPWVMLEKEIFKRKGSPRVMVFGGKSMGKSTLLRVLINRIIPQRKKILFIDLDPGQSEFTPPGCVSAVLVKKPLLGPNFTHFIDPERCVFVGRVNIAKCPWEYLQSIEYILKWCTEEKSVQNIPWFINTMGFTKGIGVDLAIDAIKCVHPTDLIQMKSYNEHHNFPIALTSDYIKTAEVRYFEGKKTDFKYNFHFIYSSGPYKKKNASQLREVAVLAYFSKIVLGSRMSLLESNVYEFPFHELKLCICHEKVNYSYYLSAMNANVVGLCNAGARRGLIPNDSSYPQIFVKPPICDCYGLGIVRGVDMERKRVFIASPLPSSILRKVNCLILGEVYLPSTIYTKQKNTKGGIPYVVVGHNQSDLEK